MHAKSMENDAKREPKWEPKSIKNAKNTGKKACQKSADPRSGVLEHVETGEVYLPLPPPPWAPRRQPLAPIGVKTFYTYIGSTLWPFGTKFCHAGLPAPFGPLSLHWRSVGSILLVAGGSTSFH